MMKNKILLILVVATSFYCSVSKIAGGGSSSDWEARTIAGIAISYSDSSVISNANIRLRPYDYFVGKIDTSINSNDKIIDSKTDSMGNFAIESISSGKYKMEILSSENFGLLIPVEITDTTKVINLGKVVLKHTGVLKGKILLPLQNFDSPTFCSITIYGIDRSKTYTYKNQDSTIKVFDFSFNNLPEGSYRLRILPNSNTNDYIDLGGNYGFRVAPDSTTNIGNFTVPLISFSEGCSSYECDSAVVYSILQENTDSYFIDTMYLPHYTVSDVAETDPNTGRIIKLNLQNKNIHKLSSEIGKLSQLTKLDISGNRLLELPKELGYCQKLTDLNCSYNSLVSIPDEIAYLRSLRKLFIDKNKISRLPESISHLDSLTVLSAQFNNLDILPKDFGQLNLSKLNLMGNNFITFPEQICSITSLRELILDRNNDMTSLPTNIKNLENLTTLSVAFCSISDIPTGIKELKDLQVLNLMSNYISEVPDVIGRCSKLTSIRLNQNVLETITDSIVNLKNLKNLELQYNNLKQLPGTIGECISLTSLNISYNILNMIPGNITNLTKLEKFDVVKNKLCADNIPLKTSEFVTKFNSNWQKTQNGCSNKD